MTTTPHEHSYTIEVTVTEGIILITCICGEYILDRRFTPRSSALTK